MDPILNGLPNAMDPGMFQAVSNGVDNPEDDENSQKEMSAVKSLWEDYSTAREFAKEVRRQYVKDRKYAAGLSDTTWASDANMIGSIVDILVSYLYAKDPRFAADPAKRVTPLTPLETVSPMNPAVLGAQLAPPMPGAVPGAPPGPSNPGLGLPAPPAGGMVPGVPGAAPGMPPLPGAPPGMPPIPGMPMQPPKSQDQLDAQALAETLTLVINRLWKDAKLKKTARRWLRSALSVGVGWFKVLLFTEKQQDPQIAGQLHDLKASLEEVQGLQKQLSYDGYGSPEERDAKIDELEQTIEGMGPKLEKVIRQGLHIDFIPAEQMTVWLDVATTEDYCESGALAEDIYVPRAQLCKRFPKLSEEQIKTATSYHQRKTTNKDVANLSEDSDQGTEGVYTKGSPDIGSGVKRAMDYCKIVEVWDRKEGRIKTMVDGVKLWAVDPYSPPQATTRFYPHFRLALYECDGLRDPQSLSWRLYKLQDEYSACRSAQRTTRERSVPGIIFNEGMLGKDQVTKLKDSAHQEYTGLNPTDPNARMDQLLVQKEVGQYDPRLFDTTPIVADMAKVSGVQEPQQGAGNPEITATQSQIEQNGFRSRTGTDRDTLEEVLNELALYCTECALNPDTGVTVEYATRIAGPAAFWPSGMDVQDVLTLVEVDIEAGSTGKPGGDASREAWATLLPQIKETQIAIRQFDLTDPPLAMAMRNTLKETIRRLDDRINVDQFIPPASVPPLMPPMAPPGPGTGTPEKASGAPPGPPMIQ